MYIVRINRPDGTKRYVLITGVSDINLARTQAEARLAPGESAGIAVPASAQGIATMRRDAPDFEQQFGVDTSIWEIIQRLQGQAGDGDGTVVDGDWGLYSVGGLNRTEYKARLAQSVELGGITQATADGALRYHDAKAKEQLEGDEAAAQTQDGTVVDGGLTDREKMQRALDAAQAEADRLAAQAEADRLAGLGFDPSAETDPALRREAFEFGPGFEAGLRGRGINIGPGGGLQGAIAQRRQRALQDRFYTQQALQPGSGLTTETAYPTFQSFLSGRTGGGDTFTNPLFGQAGAQAARGLLNQARGFTAPASQALPSDLAGGVLNPATIGQGQTLANVALEAGRQRFGSLSRFLPGAQDLSQSFLSDNQLNPAGVPMSFADYLNQRIFG